MKSFKYILSIIFFLAYFQINAQNWSTFGGKNEHNGLSKITGPQNVNSAFWNISSTNLTTLGNAVYTFGNKFVTSRVKFAPYTGLIECRDLQTGSLNWTTPFISNTSILYCIGFNEDGVYAHDYDSDSIYAFNPDDGTIKWSSQLTSQTFGAYPGCVFACNGDLIVNGPGPTGMSTMRLDKYTGDTLWTNANTFSIGPAVGLAANETTVYRITGAVTAPIRLTAIDINTGATKYFTPHIPGDPDQENPIVIGSNGIIYFWRDGGNLFAYEDNGTGFLQTWFYTPQSTTGAAFYGNIAEGVDGNLYIFDSGKVRRIDYTNGGVLDSSLVIINQGSISVGADSTVYVNDQNGMFYALTYDLQTVKWQKPINDNYYCNPALSKDGIMVLTGGGYTIQAYKPAVSLKPVTDFRVSTTKIFTGQAIDFFDQSSYLPVTWQWYFPGANTTMSTQQNPTGIIYSLPGVYDVSLTTTNASGADSVIKTCYLLVEQATGLEEFSVSGLQLMIYPNPVKEGFNVQCSMFNVNRIEIFDLRGRKIQSEKFPGKNEFFISVKNIDSGIYFLKIYDETKNKFAIKKFCKK